MALIYYCPECATKIPYLTEKPKSCPKCCCSFGAALETATKRAEILARNTALAGRTKIVQLVNEEDFEEKITTEVDEELERQKRLKKIKLRQKKQPSSIRRFSVDEDDHEADASQEIDPDENEFDDLVDIDQKNLIKRQLLAAVKSSNGFRVEGSNESVTFRELFEGSGR